jgi:predicted dehydrogenase
MKQVVQNFRTGELKVDEVPAPTLKSGGLLVANRVSLISAGTEKSTVSVAKKSLVGKALDRPDQVRKVLDKAKKDGVVDTMKMVFARLDAPAALGYSCAGIVQEVGRDVSGFEVGDRVACAGQNYASHADLVYIPKNLCVKIPDGVDFDDAAYVAMGAIAMQGVRQADAGLGDSVAVIGLGMLGQLTVQMLKASGCTVIASDVDPSRLEMAAKFGADDCVLSDALAEATASMTTGKGVDAVIITASTKDDGPVRVAGEIARKKGRVVVVGAVGMNIPREQYYLKELELRLSSSYGPGRYDASYEEQGNDYPYGYVRWTEGRNMQAFLSLLDQGKLDVKTLSTHKYAIDKAEDAYTMMMENKEPYTGILLIYSEEEKKPVRKIELNPAAKLGTVNMGLIGAGNHVKDMLVPALTKSPGVRIRTVCTGTGINARALGEKLDVAYCTSDMQEVLDDRDINAVLIGTRHNSHAGMVMQSLAAGKHVFVEKPLCLTREELESIAELYNEKAADGLQLIVGFNRRFSMHGGRAKEFFSGHRDPLVMTFRVNAGAIPGDHWIQDMKTGGGRIIGEACHFIDYMQYVCGSRPVTVVARSIGSHSSGITDDQCVLCFTFSDGSIGTVIYCAGGDTSLAKERFEVFGDGKSLVMDDFMTTEFYSNGKRTSYKSGKRDKGFQAEMEAFAAAAAGKQQAAMEFDDIYAVTLASILAAESLKTGTILAL